MFDEFPENFDLLELVELEKLLDSLLQMTDQPSNYDTAFSETRL